MKTEHEKLLAGQAYDYRDPELQQLIVRGKQLLTVINGGQGAARQAAIQDFFGRMGQRLTINGYFNAVYGVHIQVGDDVFINGNCTFQDSNQIILGDRVIIAPDVKLYCGSHALDATHRFGVRLDGSRYLITTTAPIMIGNDVWIGGNVTVIGGVHIGNNVVVGAGAVVTKDVPDNMVVAGVPARIIETLPPLSRN